MRSAAAPRCVVVKAPLCGAQRDIFRALYENST